MSTTRNPTPQQTPSLPTNRAFVVQFHSRTDGSSPQWAGRVEHVSSGQAIHFDSWEQLQQFVAQVLQSLPEQPP